MLALLSELVENAVIYSHDGGLVEIALAALSDGRLALAIRDHGIGIPERCLPRIFDEDYRADLAVKHHQDGAGLGLAIAREIADLHRFGLAAESEEGRGSVFTVTVPDGAGGVRAGASKNAHSPARCSIAAAAYAGTRSPRHSDNSIPLSMSYGSMPMMATGGIG